MDIDRLMVTKDTNQRKPVVPYGEVRSCVTTTMSASHQGMVSYLDPECEMWDSDAQCQEKDVGWVEEVSALL